MSVAMDRNLLCLPTELLVKIVKSLDLCDRFNLSRTCKRLEVIVTDQYSRRPLLKTLVVRKRELNVPGGFLCNHLDNRSGELNLRDIKITQDAIDTLGRGNRMLPTRLTLTNCHLDTSLQFLAERAYMLRLLGCSAKSISTVLATIFLSFLPAAEDHGFGFFCMNGAAGDWEVFLNEPLVGCTFLSMLCDQRLRYLPMRLWYLNPSKGWESEVHVDQTADLITDNAVIACAFYRAISMTHKEHGGQWTKTTMTLKYSKKENGERIDITLMDT